MKGGRGRGKGERRKGGRRKGERRKGGRRKGGRRKGGHETHLVLPLLQSCTGVPLNLCHQFSLLSPPLGVIIGYLQKLGVRHLAVHERLFLFSGTPASPGSPCSWRAAEGWRDRGDFFLSHQTLAPPFLLFSRSVPHLFQLLLHPSRHFQGFVHSLRRLKGYMCQWKRNTHFRTLSTSTSSVVSILFPSSSSSSSFSSSSSAAGSGSGVPSRELLWSVPF